MTADPGQALSSFLTASPRRLTMELSAEDFRSLCAAILAGRPFDVHGPGFDLRLRRRESCWPKVHAAKLEPQMNTDGHRSGRKEKK